VLVNQCSFSTRTCTFAPLAQSVLVPDQLASKVVVFCYDAGMHVEY